MKKLKFIAGIFAIIGSALAIFMVLRDENALVANPKGTIAQSILNLITTNILLMLLVIIPTFFLLLLTAWRYRSSNLKAQYDPEQTYGFFGELILWIIPSIIIAVMAMINWEATHKLDPYQPLKSDIKPLTIQVVALDWKWLFIYPEQGIATLNFVQFPALTPIHFALSADGSPMNSFWIPQLSGQIYAMTGMVTPLHLMASEPGDYRGKAAEINGEGYADMNFIAKATSETEFDEWIKNVRRSPLQLSHSVYSELLKPSINHPISFYSDVEQNLFDYVVMKPMHPNIK